MQLEHGSQILFRAALNSDREQRKFASDKADFHSVKRFDGSLLWNTVRIQLSPFNRMGSRLERITDWEARARRAKFRVAELAGSLNVTPRHLERYFLKTFSCHPKDWMQDLRMNEAMCLMKRGLLAKEIAERLGFKHATHFSRAFRQRLKSSAARWLDK